MGGVKILSKSKDKLIKRILIITALFLSLLPRGYAKDPLKIDPPFKLPAFSELRKIRTGKIITNKGEIYFELYPESAPYHVANFKYLADKGYYNGTYFSLFIHGLLVQGGSVSGSLSSGPGYSLPPEFNEHKHQSGALSMARVEDNLNPERRSHGSQFAIILGNASHMDGAYTVFGKVVKGLDVARSLRKGDRILSLIVYVKQ